MLSFLPKSAQMPRVAVEAMDSTVAGRGLQDLHALGIQIRATFVCDAQRGRQGMSRVYTSRVNASEEHLHLQIFGFPGRCAITKPLLQVNGMGKPLF